MYAYQLFFFHVQLHILMEITVYSFYSFTFHGPHSICIADLCPASLLAQLVTLNHYFVRMNLKLWGFFVFCFVLFFVVLLWGFFFFFGGGWF